MSKLHSIAFTLMLGLALGCSDEDEPAEHFAITPKPIPGCERESFSPCDVGSESCQQAVFSTVACLRGSKGVKRPSSRTVTASAYGREIAAAVGEVDAAEVLAYENGMILLGLAKPGELSVESRIGVSTSTVPAFYNWQTKQVTFVIPDDDTTTQRNDSAYLLLAHEYVHALQDQEHDLGKLEETYSTSTDSSLALRSLVEGEAVTHENRFLAATWGLDPDDLDWAARYAGYAHFSEEYLADIAPVLAIWRSFPYEAGGLYVHGVFSTGGMKALRSLYAAPPRACLTITAGVTPIPIEAEPPKPPDGFEVLTVDTLGSELLRASMSQLATLTDTEVELLAADWRSDRLYLYVNRNTEHVIVLWRLRFAGEASKNLITNPNVAWQSAAVDGDVLIGFTTDPDASTVIATCITNAKNGVAATPPPTDESATQATRPPRWVRPIPHLDRNWLGVRP